MIEIVSFRKYAQVDTVVFQSEVWITTMKAFLSVNLIQ